jgi:divalent metal cation (Fe/Co/Zn/Cd) transporter
MKAKNIITLIAISALLLLTAAIFITLTAGWPQKDQQEAATLLMVFIMLGVLTVASIKERMNRRKRKKINQSLKSRWANTQAKQSYAVRFQAFAKGFDEQKFAVQRED